MATIKKTHDHCCDIMADLVSEENEEIDNIRLAHCIEGKQYFIIRKCTGVLNILLSLVRN